jgi:hypothetical protein
MDVPIMEFFAALGAGVLVSLWSKYLLPLLPRGKCCKPNAAEPDDVSSAASTAAVMSVASTTHF